MILELAGDPSDNIPGIKGIGIKKGAKLLREYGTIEMIPEDILSHEQKEEVELWKRISRVPYHIT